MTSIQHIKLLGIYLLIGIYSIVLLKPLLPFAQDFIAHTFYATEHTATVHFENGKYHVHKEVETAAKNQNNPSKEKRTTSFDAKIDVHFICEPLILQTNNIPANANNAKIYLKNDDRLTENRLKTPYPPPQV